MLGSAVFRTGVAPGGALAGPWVRNPLWAAARAVPSLDLRFADNKSLVDATTGQNLVTFTRASSGTYVDSQGVIRTATTNEARFDHNPTTGESLGLLVEEQRTNSIRNNTMVGAVAGTPGTLPTNWTESLAGLTREVVGIGTQNGVSYIDIRLSGTSTGTQAIFRWDGGITAAEGQSWAHSAWIARVSGSLPSGSIVLAANLFNASSVYVGDTNAIQIKSLISDSFRRVSGVNTISTATTATARPYIYFLMANGESVDFTLRIGMPQFEQGAFATSVIPTTTATVTRSADVASITGSNFSGWYRQDEGTFYSVSETLTGVTATNRFILEVNTGTGSSSDKWDMRRTGSTAVRTTARIGGVSTADRTESLASSVARAAAGANGASVSLAVNGGIITPVANTVGAMPAVTQMQIGNGGDAATLHLNGTIRRLCYWNQRLPNNTLQGITQ